MSSAGKWMRDVEIIILKHINEAQYKYVFFIIYGTYIGQKIRQGARKRHKETDFFREAYMIWCR